MELNSSIAANDRSATNIEEGIGWLNTTDSALGQVGDSLQTVLEKTVEGGNGGYDTQERQALKDYIEQLKQQVIQIGNTNFDGRYIFGGDKTTNPPLDSNGNYLGSNNGLVREFSPGVTIDIGTSGSKFQEVVGTLNSIISRLDTNTPPTDMLTELQGRMDDMLAMRSKAGALSHRLEAMKSKNGDETLNMTQLLSKTADIDIAQKTIEYKMAENVYMASLQTGAKILQPSLLDFLR
jgi:flagellar hook-associated protein 3 FlgL